MFSSQEPFSFFLSFPSKKGSLVSPPPPHHKEVNRAPYVTTSVVPFRTWDPFVLRPKVKTGKKGLLASTAAMGRGALALPRNILTFKAVFSRQPAAEQDKGFLFRRKNATKKSPSRPFSSSSPILIQADEGEEGFFRKPPPSLSILFL